MLPRCCHDGRTGETSRQGCGDPGERAAVDGRRGATANDPWRSRGVGKGEVRDPPDAVVPGRHP